jgi:hypothetical protein
VEGESADALLIRQNAFPLARQKCIRLNKEKADKRNTDAMLVDLNQFTGGSPSDPDGGGGLKRQRPKMQTTLDQNTEKNMLASEALARSRAGGTALDSRRTLWTTSSSDVACALFLPLALTTTHLAPRRFSVLTS